MTWQDLIEIKAASNLHDIPINLPFRVELWNWHDQSNRARLIECHTDVRKRLPRDATFP